MTDIWELGWFDVMALERRQKSGLPVCARDDEPDDAESDLGDAP